MRAKFMFNTPKSLHAEADALIKFQARASQYKNQKVDLLVVRADSEGNLGMSLPCFACVRLLIKYSRYIKLSHIYYSNSEGQIIKTNLNTLASNTNVRLAPAYQHHDL